MNKGVTIMSSSRNTKDRIIPLTEEQYSELERALQWPEDIERYDRIAKPTNLTELSFDINKEEGG